MSIDIMNRVWKESQFRETRLLFLLACADGANDIGEFYPSYQTLAQKARISRRYAIDLMLHCQTHGLIVKEPHHKHQSNLYLLVPDKIPTTPDYHRGKKLSELEQKTPTSEPRLTTQLVNPDSLALVNPDSPGGEPRLTSTSEPRLTSLVNPSSPKPLLNHQEEPSRNQREDAHAPNVLPDHNTHPAVLAFRSELEMSDLMNDVHASKLIQRGKELTKEFGGRLACKAFKDSLTEWACITSVRKRTDRNVAGFLDKWADKAAKLQRATNFTPAASMNSGSTKRLVL